MPATRIVLAAAASALALAACGSSSSGTTSSAATTTAPAATTSAPAASAPPSSSAQPVDTEPAPQGPSAVTDGSPIGDIKCEQSEGVALHIHSGLAIVLDRQRVHIPANIGINLDKQCLYWLHTHVDLGVIHIESPSTQLSFTLGQFFEVWGYPLSSNEILDFHGALRAWVNGKPYAGDPASIPLRDLETIVISNEDLTGNLPTVDFAEVQ